MLSRIKRQQDEAQSARDANGKAHGVVGNSEPVAVLRLKKDLDNLDGIHSKVEFPEPHNILRMRVTVKPLHASIWYGGRFEFLLEFKDEYPYEGPKVRYLGPRRIWHPNIEGDEYVETDKNAQSTPKTSWGVCLSFQTEWKPTFSLRDIIIMIELLFQDPNPDDPLHGTAKQAAQMMKDNPSRFREKAQQWMRGCYIE